MVRVGFSVRNVGASLPPDKPARDPVTSRVFYGEGDGGGCVWAVLDFMDFGRRIVATIQGAVADRTGIPPERIHVVTTHNHSAGSAYDAKLPVLAEETATAAAEARRRARPATLRYALTTVGRNVSYRRRLHVKELGGAATFWFGITEAEGLSGARLLRQTVRKLMRDRGVAYSYAGMTEPAPEERFIDEALALDPGAFRMGDGDRRLQVLAFEDESGECIGSFVRFAVHVAAVNRRTAYSSDFPHFVRSRLESCLGGTAIYFSGPCGNISPAIPDERSETGEPLSGVLAEAALAAIRQAKPAPIERLADAARDVPLPVNPDFPRDDAAADAQAADLAARLQGSGIGLAERRRLAERIGWLRLTKTMRNQWECLDYPDGPSAPPEVRVRLGLLRLNDIALLAFPGETFWETGDASLSGLDASRIVTVTEHGRTAMYLPPPDEWDLGGYEATCCAVAQEGETVLRRAAREFLAQHMG